MSRSSKWWKVWTQSTARSSCGNEGRLSSARKLSRGLKTEKQSLPLEDPVELWLPSEQHFTLSHSSLLSHALLCSLWCDFKSEFLRIHLDQLAIWSRWDMTEYWLVAVMPEQWVETAAQLGNTGVVRLDEKSSVLSSICAREVMPVIVTSIFFFLNDVFLNAGCTAKFPACSLDVFKGMPSI